MEWMLDFFSTKSKVSDFTSPRWLLEKPPSDGSDIYDTTTNTEFWFPDEKDKIKLSPFYTVLNNQGNDHTLPDFFSEDKYFCKDVTGPVSRVSKRKQRIINKDKNGKTYKEIFLDELLNYDFVVSDDKLDLISDLFHSWIDLHYFSIEPDGAASAAAPVGAPAAPVGAPAAPVGALAAAPVGAPADDVGAGAGAAGDVDAPTGPPPPPPPPAAVEDNSNPIFEINEGINRPKFNILSLKGKWFQIGERWIQITRVILGPKNLKYN